MMIFRRHWTAFLLVLVALMGAVSLANVASRINQPFGGFYSSRNYSSNRWQVDASTPQWWSGLGVGYLQYEDELVALDQRPYTSTAGDLFAAAKRAGHAFVSLTIKRDGRIQELILPLETFSWNHFLDLRLADFVSGLGLWLLALAVYRTRPLGQVNQLFAVAAGFAAAGLWCGILDLFPESSLLARAQFLFWIVRASFTGVAIFHLAVVFPVPVRRIPISYLGLLYASMGVSASLFVLATLQRWNIGDTPLSDFLTWLGHDWLIGVFGLSFAAYLARMLYLVSRPVPQVSRRIHRQSILMLIGLAFSAPYVIVRVLRAFIGTTPAFFWNGLDVRYLVLMLPLSFVFVILRYQTFRRTPPVTIGVLMLVSSAMVASLVAWLLGHSVSSISFLALFLVAFLSSVFWSAQSSWWGTFSRFFQWERRSYGAARQFGQHVVGQIGLLQLPESVAAALVAKMELERAAVWLWNDTGQLYQLAGQAGDWLIPPPSQLTPGLTMTTEPVRLHVEAGASPAWLLPAQATGSIEVMVPLIVSGKPVGLLGLGKRWDDDIFDVRDLEVVELIAQQAALFLLTARQIEQLRQVPAQVSAAQERERFGIAQELHDTVQQFLGRLPFYLQVTRDSLRTDPAEAERLLQRSLNEVEIAAQTVRQIRNNIWPLQLEQTFTQPLMALVEHFSARTGLAVSLTLFPDLDAALPTDARHALYRVIQQALDNIAEHAQARNIAVTLSQAADRLHFTITDDGTGFTPDQRAHAEGQGSFGLQSMRARITALGGEFAIQSQPEQGTAVTGWLPTSLSRANPSPSPASDR